MAQKVNFTLKIKASLTTNEAYVRIAEYHYNHDRKVMIVGTRPYFSKADRDADAALNQFMSFGERTVSKERQKAGADEGVMENYDVALPGIGTMYTFPMTEAEINQHGMFKAAYTGLAKKISEEMELDVAVIENL